MWQRQKVLHSRQKLKIWNLYRFKRSGRQPERGNIVEFKTHLQIQVGRRESSQMFGIFSCR